MSNSMKVEGYFGVDIHDKDGNKVDSRRSHNLVAVNGIKQLKRWLDRLEYADNPPIYNNWKDVAYCAGEEKRITILPKADFTGGNWWEYSGSGYGPSKMFDGSYSSYSYHYLDQNGTEYLYVYLTEKINLKKVGIVCYDISGYWHNNPVQQLWRIRQECFGVQSAGSTGYNSYNYFILDATYNDNSAYKMMSSAYYLFVNAAKTKWVLSTSLGGTAAYETSGTTLPATPNLGTWVQGALPGTLPVPTVTNQNGSTSSANWQYPLMRKGGVEFSETGYRGEHHFCNDSDYNTWYDDTSPAFIGKIGYQSLTFHGIEELDSGLTWYGFVPNVRDIQFYDYCENWTPAVRNQYVFEMHLHEAFMHPQNPYALKLGTDNGSILPLASSNTALGAYSSGMQWKVDSASQNGYTVRFSKYLGPTVANGVSFKEIGLFGNLDGHLITSRTEPNLANASGLFARSIFDTPWTKTADQTATIYYEISVDAGSSSSSSSSSSSM